MKRKLLLLLTVYMGCIFATYALKPEASSSDYIVNTIDDAVYPANNLNLTTFEVYTEQSGKYHAEFWLLPAKYADGSYTRFLLFLNGDPAGTITPTEGNWQSASIDNGGTLELLEGKNIISIGTPAPEIPSVETIKIAANADDARISSEAYNSFLNKAVRNSTYQVCDIADNNEPEYSTDGETQIRQIDNVPLKYTFYKIFSFTKGQDIFLTSTSSDEHNIDMVYYGKEFPSNNTTLQNLTNPYDTIPEEPYEPVIGPAIERMKQRYPYDFASSEEMQELNWRDASEKALYSRTHIATIHETIPKTGVYFVRIRHKNPGSMGVANLNVNGTYFFENVPMTFTYIAHSMPADGISYESFTTCSNPDKDDPILFVHGANDDKIVGINDDCDSRQLQEILELSLYDSYIAQKYRLKTSGLSVSNYWSSDPESQCTIYTHSPQTIIPYKPSLRTKDNQINRSNIDKSNTQGSITLNNDSGVLSISSLNTDILRITAYDMFGKKISSIEPNGRIVSVPLSSLRLNGQGTYIIFVETAETSFSKKIMLR